jgi:zinc transporter, ZIP family
MLVRVGGAFFWGTVASSSLLIGGVVALVAPLHERVVGLLTAFGAGVLISAVAYELVQEAANTSNKGVAAGLAAGSLTFYVGDLLIDRMGGDDRKSMEGRQAGGVALALVLGTVLDGIPESAVLGLGLLGGEGVSVAVLAAVFLSNFPEATAASTGLAKSGWTAPRILGLWAIVVAVSGLASLAGYGFFDAASPTTIAFVLAFAGGAILTMLADTMVPEAFRLGGSPAGLFTTLGFALAFGLSALD